MAVTIRVAMSVAGVALVFPLQSSAQQSPDTARLADVVVTATRHEVSRRSVAASVTVVTGAELRARGIRFVLDWLREVPGAALAQNGSFGAVASLFLRGGESDYTKVLLDGVPVNTPGGAVNLAHLSTENVERIEVLRGPASVLYGADAVAGVVHVITRRGRDPTGAELSARGGTFETTDLGAAWHGSTSQTEWSLALAHYQTAGIYTFNNRYRATTGSGRLGIRPDQGTDLAITARWVDAVTQFPTDFTGTPRDSNQYLADEGLTLGLEAGRDVSRWLSIRLQTTLFAGDGNFENRPDHPGDTLGFGFDASRSSRVGRRLLDLRAVTRPQAQLLVTGGLEVGVEEERQTSRTRSNFGGGATTASDVFDHSRSHRAGYLQGQWSASPATDLHAGIRLDDNETFGRFFTWRAGAVVRPTAALRLHAAAGSAFKAPTFSEQFANTPFEVGNPDLTPERSRSWEAGIEASVGSLTAGATWFDQRFSDMIQYRPPRPGEPTYANVARASARGIEVAAGWSPRQKIQLRAGWTGLRTRVESAGPTSGTSFAPGQRLLRRPGSVLTAGLRWTPVQGVVADASVIRVGRRDDVDFRTFPEQRVSLAGYSLVDLALTLPLRGPVHLTAAARNLFDASYESVVGYPGIGRLILAGLRIGGR